MEVLYFQKGFIIKVNRVSEILLYISLFDVIFWIFTKKTLHVLAHFFLLVSLQFVFDPKYMRENILMRTRNIQKKFSPFVEKAIETHNSMLYRLILFFISDFGIIVLSVVFVVISYFTLRSMDISIYGSVRKYFFDIYYQGRMGQCLLNWGYDVLTLLLYFFALVVYLLILRMILLIRYVTKSITIVFKKDESFQNVLSNLLDICSQKDYFKSSQDTLQISDLLKFKECLINITMEISTQIDAMLSVLKRSLGIVALVLFFGILRLNTLIKRLDLQMITVKSIIYSFKNMTYPDSQHLEVVDGLVIVLVIFIGIILLLSIVSKTLSAISELSSTVTLLLLKISRKIKENALLKLNPGERDNNADPVRVFLLLSIVDQHYKDVSSIARASLSLSLSGMDIFSFIMLFSMYLITFIPLVHNRVLLYLLLLSGLVGLFIGGILLVISSSLSPVE